MTLVLRYAGFVQVWFVAAGAGAAVTNSAAQARAITPAPPYGGCGGEAGHRHFASDLILIPLVTGMSVETRGAMQT